MGHPSSALDDLIMKRRKDSDNELFKVILQCDFPKPGTKRQCSQFVKHLHIHRHLFVHTFVHLASCCGTSLSRLVENANLWQKWDSIQQLVHHTLIRRTLLGLWPKTPCYQHKSLYANQFQVIDFDGRDLLCHLLYCGKQPELYELHKEPAVWNGHGYVKQSEQVIELFWQHIEKVKEDAVLQCLRAWIYRLTKEYSYLPHALRIDGSIIYKERPLGYGRLRGMTVAIKEITPASPTSQQKCIKALASEVVLWNSLQHDNLVPFLGVIAKVNSGVGLVSPLYRLHGNVKDYMKKFDPHWLTPQRRLALAKGLGKDLARALKYIHFHDPPIVHGNIKPSNVLIDDSGHARLGDFDTSRALRGIRMKRPCDSHWDSISIRYIAPEQMSITKWDEHTDKTDIYAFGCVLYEMVSGKIPFEGCSPSNVMQLITSGKRPDRPHSISQSDPVWRTIESCWKGHPKDRPSALQLFPSLA